MNQQQIVIEEKSTIYNIKMSYHSDMMCQNYDSKIIGTEHDDGKISICPPEQWGIVGLNNGFVFNHSDPDRAIAIAQMIIGFAQMVKNNKQTTKNVDTCVNE